jgi:hypothetical protein
MVANPYKAALARAVEQAKPVAAQCAAALDGALGAMRSKAWVSGAADSFFSALTANDHDAERSGQDCVDALQRAMAGCPDQVPAGSPDTKWQRMY